MQWWQWGLGYPDILFYIYIYIIYIKNKYLCMKTLFFPPPGSSWVPPCGLKPFVTDICSMVSGLDGLSSKVLHSTSHSLVIVGLGTSAMQKLQFPSLATHCCTPQMTVILMRRDTFSMGYFFLSFLSSCDLELLCTCRFWVTLRALLWMDWTVGKN